MHNTMKADKFTNFDREMVLINITQIIGMIWYMTAYTLPIEKSRKQKAEQT